MKNKHPHAAVVLVLGLAMAGLHLADLLLWSEADTGFAAAGSVWLRYIPWLAAFALPKSNNALGNHCTVKYRTSMPFRSHTTGHQWALRSMET